MTLRVLDLFSGIGGFSLGLERAGMRTVAFCEIDPYCRAVLRKHWPEVPIHEDIRKLDGRDFRDIDVVCGGFPCQPHSRAGKQRGSEDYRDLWPEMVRFVGESFPRWVICENTLGLIERTGYETRAFVLPACAVNAWHRRDRIWIVAHPEWCERGDGEY